MSPHTRAGLLLFDRLRVAACEVLSSFLCHAEALKADGGFW